MDLNNKCNLKCITCHFHLDFINIPAVNMNMNLFKRIAKEVFPRTNQLNISCSAEPLLIPKLRDYLCVIKKYRIPATYIVTNGILMGEEQINSFIANNITAVEISFFGATRETHENIAKRSSFDKMIENVKLLCQTKQKLGIPNPKVQLNYTLMRSNYKELPAFVELSYNLGADQVRATHLILFKSLNLGEESLVNIKKEANAVFDQVRKIADKLNFDVKIPPNFNITYAVNKRKIFNKLHCDKPNNSMYIISDGRVLPCTWFPLKKYCAGNFNYHNFEEIWNGEVYKKLRLKFKSLIFTKYCKDCPPWGDFSIDGYTFLERKRLDVANITSSPI